MENKLLQSLLQAGLIDIGDNDERLVNIEQSIADVQQKLENDYSLFPSYTLIALDPGVSPSEQIMEDTESIIASHWKALRGKFTERPVPMIRAVILHALYNLGIENSNIARIVYLTASNFFPYAKLGKEKHIIVNVIGELGNLAEKEATAEWSLIDEEPTFKVGALKIAGLKFENVSVDVEELKSGLKIAAGTHPSTGHGPQNGTIHWQNHFSETASVAIKTVLESALSQLTRSFSPTSIENPINKFFSEFKTQIDSVLTKSFDSITAVERRSKLLWWKETLYSSSTRNSYRVLNYSVQPIVMAFDLYEQLPAITPASVDFLLRDTLLLLNPEASQKITFAQFLSDLTSAENKVILKDYFDEPPQNGRITITDFFALVTHEKTSPDAFKQYTGVDASETVSLADIAVIVLHDLLASYLISE